MSTNNPLKNPSGWDVIKIAGKTSPGLATVSGVRLKNKIEILHGYGLSLPRLKFTGREILDFQVDLRFWNEEDIDQFEAEIEPLLVKNPVSKINNAGFPEMRALNFFHPATSAKGITSVVPGEVGQLVQIDDGLWSIDFKLFPFWGNPKIGLAKPISSGNDTPTPQDAADVLTLKLLDQVADLGKR
jgi:hypothetical protein